MCGRDFTGWRRIQVYLLAHCLRVLWVSKFNITDALLVNAGLAVALQEWYFWKNPSPQKGECFVGKKFDCGSGELAFCERDACGVLGPSETLV